MSKQKHERSVRPQASRREAIKFSAAAALGVLGMVAASPAADEGKSKEENAKDSNETLSKRKKHEIAVKLAPSKKKTAQSREITVTVINESQHVIKSGGNVALKYDATGEVVGVYFGRILPGQNQIQSGFMNDDPDQVFWGFTPEDGAGYWAGAASPGYQFASVTLHAQNP